MPEHPWPPYDLRIHTPRLEMRVITEADIPAVIDAVKAGIHDPGVMPFLVPFTDRPSPELEWETYRWHSATLGARPEKWALQLGAWLDGRFVGEQGIHAEGFVKKREVHTGSWLQKDHHGQALGKEMRAAVLHVAFDALGAELATSESFVNNPQSEAVSRAMGYEENGVQRHLSRDEPLDATRWRLTRERFEELRAAGRYTAWAPVEIEGVEACLPFLGLA